MFARVYQKSILPFVVIAGCVIGIYGCSSSPDTEEKAIVEMYSQIMQAYAREDLRGIMLKISKEFHSNVENLQSYSEVLESRRLFILNNSSVSVNFRDISIDIGDNGKAEVSLKVNIITDQNMYSWKEIDMLQKSWGNWEIYSWNIHKNN